MGPLAQAAICPQGLSSLAGEPTPNHQRQDAPPPLSAPSGPVSSRGVKDTGPLPHLQPSKTPTLVGMGVLCLTLCHPSAPRARHSGPLLGSASAMLCPCRLWNWAARAYHT